MNRAVDRARGLAALAGAIPLLSGCVVATTSSSRGSSGGGFFLFFLPFLLFILMARLARRRHRPVRQVRRAAPLDAADAPNVSMIRAELSVLADDVLRLEPQVALHPAARDDYESATHRYKVAQAALDQAGDAVDLVRVQRVVDEASYAMSRARAVIDGRTPPAPPPVLQRAGRHGEPAIELDGGRNPVYVGSAAPFRSGWFTVGGGLFGGLLLGSMFGGHGGWVGGDDGWASDDPGQDHLS